VPGLGNLETWAPGGGFWNVYQSHRFLTVRTSTNRIRIIAAIAKSSLPLTIFTFYAGNRPRSRKARDLGHPGFLASGEKFG